MDPQLRTAIDASICWYEDACTLHRIATTIEDGLWSCTPGPPPLHSDACVVEPWVSADQVAERIAGRPTAGVKDSFAALDLSGAGMSLLFSATWIHRGRGAGHGATRWSVLRDPASFAAWTREHGTDGSLLPALLSSGHHRVLTLADDDGRVVAGAVARLGSGVVDLSNVLASLGTQVDWAELSDAVWDLFPDRAIVGYERGDDLDAALAGGFSPVGDLRVWVR